MDGLLGIAAVLALVFMNGFFVSAEFAFVGSRRTRLAQLAAEGNAGAKAAEEAIKHLDSYIAATQLGITLASLGLGWVGEPAIAHLFEPLLNAILPHETVETVGHSISIAIAFAIVTLLHIVLGELAPKSIALQRPEQTSIIVARPTRLFLQIFRPVIWVMNTIGNWVVRLLGFQPASGHAQVHSAEELEMLVHSSTEAGLLQESEERMLRRVFDFSDIQIQEIMQPRVEVEAIPLDITLGELLDTVARHHYSRYPVYEESIDRVTGVLHTKDLLDTLVDDPQQLARRDQKFNLKPLLHAPLYMPMTVGLDKVLEAMRRTRNHIVIVIDEYGGMAGVATMEDIIEEIVGNVEDEFDLEAGTTATEDIELIDGLMSMSEVIERFGEPEEEPLSNTIGGYVAERLERIPVAGDQIRFGDYDARVEAMDGMRVEKVRFVRRNTPSEQLPEILE
jgi:CBS domain containing-hemolysin-like protein